MLQTLTWQDWMQEYLLLGTRHLRGVYLGSLPALLLHAVGGGGQGGPPLVLLRAEGACPAACQPSLTSKAFQPGLASQRQVLAAGPSAQPTVDLDLWRVQVTDPK